MVVADDQCDAGFEPACDGFDLAREALHQVGDQSAQQRMGTVVGVAEQDAFAPGAGFVGLLADAAQQWRNFKTRLFRWWPEPWRPRAFWHGLPFMLLYAPAKPPSPGEHTILCTG